MGRGKVGRRRNEEGSKGGIFSGQQQQGNQGALTWFFAVYINVSKIGTWRFGKSGSCKAKDCLKFTPFFLVKDIIAFFPIFV